MGLAEEPGQTRPAAAGWRDRGAPVTVPTCWTGRLPGRAKCRFRTSPILNSNAIFNISAVHLKGPECLQPVERTERIRKMRMCTTRRAEVPTHSWAFCYLAVQLFVLVIFVQWVTVALADPLTLRVAEASTVYTPRPLIIIRLDEGGRQALARFTTEHVGEDVEFLVAGRMLKVRLRAALLGGILNIGDIFRADELADTANRLVTDGRIEVNTLGGPRQ
jgi:hypothetical protein